MNILEMIAEWRKGCSCSVGKSPYECRECTVDLIFAIEGKAKDAAAAPPALATPAMEQAASEYYENCGGWFSSNAFNWANCYSAMVAAAPVAISKMETTNPAVALPNLLNKVRDLRRYENATGDDTVRLDDVVELLSTPTPTTIK